MGVVGIYGVGGGSSYAGITFCTTQMLETSRLMFGHSIGQSSLDVALALANLCGGTCSALGNARRVA